MIVYIHSCTHKEAQYKSVSSEEEKIMKRKNMAAILGIVAAAAFSVTACGTGSAAETASSTASAGQSTAEESSADTTESTENSTQQGPGDGEAPEKPDGEAPSGEAPDGQGAPDGAPGGQGGPGGADTQSYDYQGETSGTKEADGEEVSSDSESISSTEADVNAALVKNAGTLTITNGTLTKSGDDTNGDNCNFYGINSILLSLGEGSKAIVSDSTLTMFATDGEILANNDTIHTTAGNSRGLDATYGGTILADSCDITTEGDHCASIATDRGGGSISAVNSTLSTAGSGSPLLYSTGDIQVDNVTGTASGSQIAGMEGLNTILIYNSRLK